jgi:glycosyltransferase involved in cell wall biosynthesis
VSALEKSVLVAQIGARRHYAVPLALHRQGLLRQFCTEFYVKSPLFRRILETSILPQKLHKIGGRYDGELPSSLVRSFPLFAMRYIFEAHRAKSERERVANWVWGGQRFCELSTKSVDEGCGTIYAFSSAAKELFKTARTLGIRTILDHATAPYLFERQLVEEESDRFPGWATSEKGNDEIFALYDERQREELELADVIICGSSFIRSAILANGAHPNKVRVVPLGIADHFFQTQKSLRRPNEPLRALFLGDDGLRKGIGYFAAALGLVGQHKVKAKVAGSLGLSAKARRAIAERATIVGSVSRKNVGTLFQWADVLVLPSVSDTFGLVILEAMASGVPVISTTHTCAPDVVRDSVDGFVTPPRDAEIIAARLEQLADDRELLGSMSAQARARALEFNLDRYAERLVAASFQ